jgi:GTP cyclohydrolase II
VGSSESGAVALPPAAVRTPVLRTPVLRTPVLRTPALRTPAPARIRRHLGTTARRLGPRALRVLGGAVMLGVVGWRLGGGPFVAGLQRVSLPALLGALAIGVVTTVLSAWRWALVARGLGLVLPLRTAVGDYYRALFLNGVLPGGVLGDVHRAVRHGRDAGSVTRAATAVLLERCAGQVVLAATAAGSLALTAARQPDALPLPGALRPGPGSLLALLVAVAAGVLLAVRLLDRLLDRQLDRGSRLAVLAISAAVLAGHVATFLLAARTAGSTAPADRLVPLLLLALLAMSLPLNVGGWGPREGATAWAFGAAGLGAAQGVTVSVVYGVLALAASLPGLAVLAARRSRRTEAGRQPVPEQDDVADLPHLGQHRPATRVARVTPVAEQPRRGRLTDEERGDHQVQLIRQPGPEELGVHRLAALDHQPPDAAVVQVGEHPAQVDRVAGVDHGGKPVEPGRGVRDLRARAVDEPGRAAGGEEPSRRIEPAGRRDRHLERGGRQPAPDPLGAPAGRPHEQPRVVRAHGPGADQDRVATGPGVVDPVEVGLVGEQHAVRRGVVEAAVEGHPAAEQHVGALWHRPVLPSSVRRQVPLPLRSPDGVETCAQLFTFDGLCDGKEHLALGLGDWQRALRSGARGGPPPLVRLHSECLTGDVLGSLRCDCGPQLHEAVARIAGTGGLLLYLRQEGRGIGLYSKLDAYELQDGGLDTYAANRSLGRGDDERDYTVAAQMLLALGAGRVALLSNNPDKAEQLGRLGVEVVERVPTGVHLSAANTRYLTAKARHGAHTLVVPGSDA